MLQKILVTIVISLFSGLSAFVFGQTPGAGLKPSVITGDVASVADKKIVVNSKTGPIDVVVTDKTEFKRVLPENPDPKAAVVSSISEIGVGDKLMVTGVLAADAKSVPARSVYLLTKSALSQKNAKDVEIWRTRGIAGKVMTVNHQTGQIGVEIRSLMGATTLVLTPKAAAKFVRYAPDSERFDEAKPSSLDEVKVGDMIRAIGDKSTDNTSFTAETVLTGAFQTVAGTVISTDPSKNEVVIKNLQTNKDVTVVVSETSVLKKYPAEMAERMAGMQMAGQGGPRPVGASQGPRPVGAAPPTAPGGQATGGSVRAGMGGRPGGGGGGVDEMLERFPTITASDLKVGDMIAVSSTKNGNVERIKAIKLLAGVEPFLRLAQATGPNGRRGQGVEGGFSIPGLDGIGFP